MLRCLPKWLLHLRPKWLLRPSPLVRPRSTWLLQLPPWVGFLGLLVAIALAAVPVWMEYHNIRLPETLPQTVALILMACGIFIIHFIHLSLSPTSAGRRRKKEVLQRFVPLIVLAIANFGTIIPFGLLEGGIIVEKGPPQKTQSLSELLLHLPQLFCIFQLSVIELTLYWNVARGRVKWVVRSCIVLPGILFLVFFITSIFRRTEDIIWYPSIGFRLTPLVLYGADLWTAESPHLVRFLRLLVSVFTLLLVASIIPFRAFLDIEKHPNVIFQQQIFVGVAGSSTIMLCRLCWYEEKKTDATTRWETDATELAQPGSTYSPGHRMSRESSSGNWSLAGSQIEGDGLPSVYFQRR
ncbi:hypothetical protein B0T14DRAFT_127163 [Immersiella caudata]|uniref:Uncharacterized protein n=1 Tax=Immersiella caudata TaxID=314043 RepID=A0AA39X5C9_9PEZI|nr:hypothetical protein B0T14DRAFT_127163 [Immersiella caudata]